MRPGPTLAMTLYCRTKSNFTRTQHIQASPHAEMPRVMVDNGRAELPQELIFSSSDFHFMANWFLYFKYLLKRSINIAHLGNRAANLQHEIPSYLHFQQIIHN